jgi:sulfite reductase subunit B
MHDTSNPYAVIKTKVLQVITETPTIKTFRLKPEVPFSFKTGQFIELTVPGVGEAPFTPSSDPARHDEIEVTIMRVGRVTEKIHQLKKNDAVGIRGPFGSGYPLDLFKGNEVVVVGGGCGFAPVRSLMYSLFAISNELKKLLFRGGCKTPQDFLYKNELIGWTKQKGLDVRLTVDKVEKKGEWNYDVGLVTTILDDLKVDKSKAYAIICGPPIMMKFCTKKLLELKFNEKHLYLSMEKNMSCGIGKCGHCRIGRYYACKDGPVFRYDTIKNNEDIWE